MVGDTMLPFPPPPPPYKSVNFPNFANLYLANLTNIKTLFPVVSTDFTSLVHHVKNQKKKNVEQITYSPAT